MGPIGHLRALVLTRAATFLDPQENDEHCDLDEMILAHEQEQNLSQENEAIPSDGGEGVVPSDLLWNNIVFLNYAIAMVDLLISQAATGRHKRLSACCAKTTQVN